MSSSKLTLHPFLNFIDSKITLSLYLETGQHIIMIKQRERGTSLDKLLITNDNEYIPVGEGEEVASVKNEVMMEAETGEIFSPMRAALDLEASEGGCILAPDGSGMGGHAEYTFDIESPGEYAIWGRVFSRDYSSDSFFVSVDGLDDVTWHTGSGGYGKWVWDVVKDVSNPLILHFEIGQHSLSIKQRDSGTKIDKILITNNIDNSKLIDL